MNYSTERFCMKKVLKVSFFLLLLSLLACETPAPSIIVGREWNAARQVVADTASEIKAWDALIVQFDYGKNFDFDSLKTEFIDGAGTVRYSKTIQVSEKMGSYTVQGKKKGAPMTAGDFFKSKKAQTVTIRFSSEAGVLAERQIQIAEGH